MTDFLELMYLPLLACLILSGMHAYLGLHVVARGVIFVDLALAQVAACGATFGVLLGFGLHSNGGYLCALGATLIGASVITFTRFKNSPVPQEAMIGIVYVIAAALAVLVLSRAPEGGEELKSLLVGHLLFVEPGEVVKLTVLYTLVGFVHFLGRHQLLLISHDPAEAERRGISIRRWDLLFYATFGVVVTSSTELAGVLLVFSYLIVPAVCGILLGHSTKSRLLVGWAVGVLTSGAGIALSYLADLPTGATIVCTFGGALLVCWLLYRWRVSGLTVAGPG